MQRLEAYLGFNCTLGIGPVRLRRLIEHFGSPEAAWLAGPAQWRAAGLDSRSVASLLETRQRLDLAAELERAGRGGIALCSWEDPRYPGLLAQLPDPPPLLYLRGELAALAAPCVAIVGTRSPTRYGRDVAYRLAGDLASAGLTVVSGLAAGVDTAAHQAALDAGGQTVAVLGGGLLRVYPARNRGLAQQIAGQGLLVSEYYPELPPLAGNFPARNRLISGLSLGVLVVEAGERSGALITAQFALEQGREVLAVPGQIYSRTSAGCNRLIAEGARLVQGVEDILGELNMGQAAIQQELVLAAPESPLEARLLKALSGEPAPIDELGRACDLAAHELAAALSLMELKGLVRHIGGLYYARGRW